MAAVAIHPGAKLAVRVHVRRGVRDGGRDRLEEVGGERRPGSVGEHEGRPRRGPLGRVEDRVDVLHALVGDGEAKLGLLAHGVMVAVEGRAPRGALPRLEPGPSASSRAAAATIPP